jgi:hypothetical protein
MDPWVASGYFLLGAGGGSLASTLLHRKQIRKLKALLVAAARNNSKTEVQVHKAERRRPA